MAKLEDVDIFDKRVKTFKSLYLGLSIGCHCMINKIIMPESVRDILDIFYVGVRFGLAFISSKNLDWLYLMS